MKSSGMPQAFFFWTKVTAFLLEKWPGLWGTTKSLILPRLVVLWFLACPGVGAALAATPSKPLLILDSHLLAALGNQIPAGFDVVSQQAVDSKRILRQVSSGGGLVWIGNIGRLPPQLWVGTFRSSVAPLSVSPAADSPLPLPALSFRPAASSSLYIKPAKEMPIHNVDEEPRADLIPVLDAVDRFGQTVGYAGALMRYYARSLVGHRFAGSDCFFFAFDDPLAAMDPKGWIRLLGSLAGHFESRLQIQRVQTDYASYRAGERVELRVTLANYREHAASVEFHYFLKAPGQDAFRELSVERRVPDGEDRTEAEISFRVGTKPGPWTIRVEAWQDLQHAEEPGIEGNPVVRDRRDIGIVVVGPALETPSIIDIDGPSTRIDGQQGFWAGTNYYPSSSWWEWLWKDFRPLEAAQDFASMRRAGYRIVRIWVDPVLDEQTLRGMDAAIYLAAQQGIVLDVCVFTQWVRDIGFERPDGQLVRFEYRNPHDFNIYGISLRHIQLQQEYAATLGRRWKGAGNIIYDLGNETYVRDPSGDQIDPLLLRHSLLTQNGTLRDTLLFRAWADDMRTAMRNVGAKQIIMPGYLFSTFNGGDEYLGNRDAPIEPWHSYASFEQTAASLSYVDPACSNRPMLLEEFGQKGWNSASHFDAMAHAALGAGAAGAMSYEWGVHWLSPELSFEPLPLRDILGMPRDPREFAPSRSFVKDWPPKSTGIYIASSGLMYGSVYTGTPFPAAAAVALGRLGRMGAGMQRAVGPQSLYVVVPSAPPSVAGSMDKVESVLQQLSTGHVAFGIVQEDCLRSLPRGPHTIVVPTALSQGSQVILANLRRSGATLLDATKPDWEKSAAIPRVDVVPSGIGLLVRDVAGGRLYMLHSAKPVQAAHLSIGNGVNLAFGLTDFAEIREHGGAVDWIEASGQVSRNGTPICSIENGRVILASAGGKDLTNASSIQVLATEPTSLRFSRKILSAIAVVNGRAMPVTSEEHSNGETLKIDDQLVRYEIELKF